MIFLIQGQRLVLECVAFEILNALAVSRKAFASVFLYIHTAMDQ